MSAAEARAVSDARPERARGWPRKALIPALVIVLIAAGVTWMNVVRTIRDPDPLAIPDRPSIAGVVWSNRVFVHERSLKRWLEARGQSYAAWARNHPRAVAVLRDRPLAPATAPVPAEKRRRTAAGAMTAQPEENLGLTTFALLAAGLLGALALLLVAARRSSASSWMLRSGSRNSKRLPWPAARGRLAKVSRGRFSGP